MAVDLALTPAADPGPDLRSPAWLPGGRLLTVGHRDDARTLLIDGEPASPPGLQVDAVLAARARGDRRHEHGKLHEGEFLASGRPETSTSVESNGISLP